MKIMKNLSNSSNPYMKSMERSAETITAGSAEAMTVSGSINKSFLLLAVMMATTLFSYQFAQPWMMYVGAIGGLVLVLISVFKPKQVVWIAPLYAAVEGLFVGSISFVYASMFSGIIFKAVMLTLGVLFMMLFLYKAEIIKVTEKFRSGVIMATGAIMIVYLLNFVLSFFGINMPFLHDGGILSIGISLFIVAIASLNLLLDFDFIERGARHGAPKYMEWMGAMGLLITLVWLYIEILRLLSMLASND